LGITALVPILLFSHGLNLLGARLFRCAGILLGDFLRLIGFRTKVVRSNLELALGKESTSGDRKKLTKKIYRNIGTVFLEIARNFSFSAARLRAELRLSASDQEKIASALNRKKGIIFISAHMGNWELLAMGMAAHGYPVAVVVKKMSNPVSQALIERQRTKTGLGVIYSGGTIEKMRKLLAQGKAIGFMFDQNTTGKKGIRTNFFGVPASAIRGLSALVRDSGAAVIPVTAVREDNGRHFLRLLDELPYLRAADLPDNSPERRAREEWLNTQQYQNAIEQLVRAKPEQWLWIHRRWKADRTALIENGEHLENLSTQFD
jgi:KDO2-lipid IV(A) lauroyltransferase